VVSTADGESAIELYRGARDWTDLVILEPDHAGMGGSKCLEQLLRSIPRAKVLIASGYTADAPVQTDSESRRRRFLSKPYNVRQMLQEVRRILDET